MISPLGGEQIGSVPGAQRSALNQAVRTFGLLMWPVICPFAVLQEVRWRAHWTVWNWFDRFTPPSFRGPELPDNPVAANVPRKTRR